MSNKDRNELKVLLTARALWKETLRLLKKEKLFPKNSRWLMAKEIAEAANKFKAMAVYANGVNPDTPELVRERHNAQRKAFALLKVIDDAMTSAREFYGFNPDELTQWAMLINEERALLSGWIYADKKRYGIGSELDAD